MEKRIKSVMKTRIKPRIKPGMRIAGVHAR
jgi:hypothetical protein